MTLFQARLRQVSISDSEAPAVKFCFVGFVKSRAAVEGSFFAARDAVNDSYSGEGISATLTAVGCAVSILGSRFMDEEMQVRLLLPFHGRLPCLGLRSPKLAVRHKGLKAEAMSDELEHRLHRRMPRI